MRRARFSNGSEYEYWEARNCGGCAHDTYEDDGTPKCPIGLLLFVEPHEDEAYSRAVDELVPMTKTQHGEFAGPCRMRMESRPERAAGEGR